jgi:erythronate-4-phosphate dehydrogenase
MDYTDDPMMKILADATLPHVSTLFNDAFKIHLFNTADELEDALPYHDILLCRSTLKITAELLANHPIQCIATASSGVDHIDTNYLSQLGITLLDAKGCNAEAVADYVTATLAYMIQNNFLKGSKAGVIGVGEVGSRVVQRLLSAGFDVACFDPLRALVDHDYSYCAFSELLQCDLLCIHANLHNNPPYSSLNLLDSVFLQQLKPGVTIINAARGGIVNEKALLELDKTLHYCTDVYCSEPAIDPEIIQFSTLCTSHIAGHTIEAKTATMIKLSQQLHHHYGLTMPKVPVKIIKTDSVFSDIHHHAADILELYNPIIETMQLKQASDKTLAFIQQRRNHQFRHDFNQHPSKETLFV